MLLKKQKENKTNLKYYNKDRNSRTYKHVVFNKMGHLFWLCTEKAAL